MQFRISMRKSVEDKINRLVELNNAGMVALEFWRDLAKILKDLAEKPIEMGEAVFDYKHGKYKCRLLVAGSIAVQFAVNEEHRSLVVQRVTISGINPYPAEVAEVLNQEP